ncbi:hypothetical protein ACM46_18100 [Chryseobacterium angstadtii]|uniref:Uncharacterized protein n=1 Tax=Chryseobacterium angstadtii TaxID=558151 RepID=A0A0J7I1M1_9FLAO|nr:hypothetical protein [Chryseobacterium angstadtii]KMQ60147.1 hypothetical protein ACM46_18100 [Chryseobacterium angstadtii]
MAKKTKKTRDHSTLYRADCIDCDRYVGGKTTKEQADIDKANHKSLPGFADHEVKIEITQRSYIK